MVQALAFLGTAFVAIGLIHYYLWRRLVRNITRTKRSRRIGTWILAGLAGLVVVTFIGSRALPRGLATVLSWPGYLWLAVMFYLMVVLAALEVPALIARLVMSRRDSSSRGEALVTAAKDATPAGAGDAPPGVPSEGTQPSGVSPDATAQSRRLLLARAVAITAGLTATGLVGSGIGSALGPPTLRRVQIPLARLPRGADGLRIALVSDIHLGPLRGVSHTRRIVEMMNSLDADLVTIVGDLVDGSVEELGEAAAPLSQLHSRYGSFFVTGNHEYFSGHEEWVSEIARLGVRPLRNEWLALPGGLDLAGVNDPAGDGYGDGPDFDKALAGRDASRPVIMLAHQPIQAPDAAARGVDLQLSGHTHGGQMVPFNVIVRLAQQPVVSGLGEVDGMPVYVTNGAGFWGPPVRVGAPPDITLVQLRRP